MVQFCCGEGDCNKAINPGTTGSPGHNSVYPMAGDSGSVQGMFLQYANGSIIKPVEIGYPPELRTTHKARSLVKRGACTDHSWKADKGKESYTKPAEQSEFVYGNTVDGGTTGNKITLSQQRTSEWSTTLGASLGFEDVVSIGVSFEQSFTKSITDSTSMEFTVPAGQMGMVVFTPTLRCSTGTTTTEPPTPETKRPIHGIFSYCGHCKN